jgi:caa(3)-type oxidase subunit IV
MKLPASTRGPLAVFASLVVLTALEITLIYVPGIVEDSLVSALVLLALAKAGLVLLFFMHLGRETWTLKLGVLLPFTLPAAYAATLIADAAWRMGR